IPVARASAALVMEPLPGGSPSNNTMPTFSGSSEDHFDAVTVYIYEGQTPTGKLAQAPTGSPSAISGDWSATVTTPLNDGTYSAVAVQPEVGGLGQTNVTPPYTFTVDTE